MKVTLYPAENPPKSPSPVNSAPITYTNSRKPDNYHSDPVWWTTKQIFISLTVVAILWWTGCLLSGLKIVVKWVGFSAPSGPEVALANTDFNAAPATIGELAKYNPEGYISKYSVLAVSEMKAFGIPASISLAQGLVESRAGTSGIARKCNNHFGIKCFSSAHKGCCMKFKDDNNRDSFKIYEKGPWGSWRAHSVMLSKGRYADLKQHGMDYRKWAYGLKAAGYATDPNYAEKLIGTIEKYNLQQFDNQ